MPTAGKAGRYHHGDLRAALIDTAIELIGERGVRGFSLAEASRRLGVAVSAPYAHFADRDDLLAAVAVHASQVFYGELVAETDQVPEPAARLAAITRAYVRFAATRRPLFEVLFGAGLDKAGHPEIEAAEKPITDAFLASVGALSDGALADGTPPDGAGSDRSGGSAGVPSEDLATAVEATAHGHAMLLLDGDFGAGPEAVELAAERAGRATLALVAGRHLLAGA
jgi:AcrR family transcriptional regulator